MKNIKTLILLFLVNQISAQIQSIDIEQGFLVFKTAKNIELEVDLRFHKDTDPSLVDKDALLSMLDYANSALSSALKSRRSYVPLSYTYKYKPNKKKKSRDKHSIFIEYEGTNSYGAAVENTASLEFNAKLKETAGSVMLRM